MDVENAMVCDGFWRDYDEVNREREEREEIERILDDMRHDDIGFFEWSREASGYYL